MNGNGYKLALVVSYQRKGKGKDVIKIAHEIAAGEWPGLSILENRPLHREFLRKGFKVSTYDWSRG